MHYTDITEHLGAYRIGDGPDCDYAEPPFEELNVLIDALDIAGEERLREVVLWMRDHERWPLNQKRWPFSADRVVLYWFDGTQNWNGIGKLIDHFGYPKLKHTPTFLDAIRSLSVALYLQSFEDSPEPNHAAAAECADWLEQHGRRPELVRGIRWLWQAMEWPVKVHKFGEPNHWWTPSITRKSWSELVEAVGRAVQQDKRYLVRYGFAGASGSSGPYATRREAEEKAEELDEHYLGYAEVSIEEFSRD